MDKLSLTATVALTVTTATASCAEHILQPLAGKVTYSHLQLQVAKTELGFADVQHVQHLSNLYGWTYVHIYLKNIKRSCSQDDVTPECP